LIINSFAAAALNFFTAFGLSKRIPLMLRSLVTWLSTLKSLKFIVQYDVGTVCGSGRLTFIKPNDYFEINLRNFNHLLPQTVLTKSEQF
jgi:hypothetical protein